MLEYYDMEINRIITEINNNRLSASETYELILQRTDNGFIKRCIERRKELCLDWTLLYSLISKINEPEYTKKCIENYKELGLVPFDIYNLILETKDEEYVKKCIKNASKFGLKHLTLCKLILTLRDEEFTKSIIEDNNIELRIEDRCSLIQTISDIEFIKKCIRNHKNLQLDEEEIETLIIKTQDKEFMKECLEKIEDYGLESKSIYNILVYIDDKELIKSFIENRRNLSLNDEVVSCLIITTFDEEYIEKCVRNFKKMEIEKKYLLDLMKQCSDEFIEKSINNEVEEIKEELSNIDKIELLYYIGNNEKAVEMIKKETKSNNITSSKKFKIPENMTIGIEIEADEGKSMLAERFDMALPDNWISKNDGSLTDGIEIVSPILDNEYENKEEEITQVCNYMKLFEEKITRKCAGHIHVGVNYLRNAKALENLIEIWTNAEEIIYIISNKEGEKSRNGIDFYARPISKKIEKTMNSMGKYENLVDYLKKNPYVNRKWQGMNFRNIGSMDKNTIEFRTPNGTLDPNTWIENVNLFAGIVKAAQDLYEIQEKKEHLNNNEIERISLFEKLKQENITDNEKLDTLLKLAIDVEDRDIYVKRYEKNSELIEENSKLNRLFKEEISQKPIDIKTICRKVFTGKEAITGQEYRQITNIIERELDREER